MKRLNILCINYFTLWQVEQFLDTQLNSYSFSADYTNNTICIYSLNEDKITMFKNMFNKQIGIQIIEQ